MAYSVSSSFIYETSQKNAELVRKFTIAGSDYSERVIKWPKFKVTWDDIRPKSVQVSLANEDDGMGFLRTDKTKMEESCDFDIGIVGETIRPFSGKISEVNFSDGLCKLKIKDKFQQLSERTMGTSDVPVDYTGSEYLPSDIAWWAITSYGGYDTATDSSNPDIDYESFSDWSAIFSGDNVLVKAIFDGQKVTEVLRKIARNTHSAIFIHNNKINFHRFGIIDANVSSIGPSEDIGTGLRFSTEDLINKKYVSGDYDVNSDYHKFTVYDEDSDSVNSYGLKENISKDVNFWYVNSQSAINFAERIILANAAPDDYLTIKAGAVLLPRIIGETVFIEEEFFGVSDSYRILSLELDMNTAQSIVGADRTMVTQPFTLDSSTLDNTEEKLS